MILDSLVNTCKDPALANILIIIKSGLDIIQIMGPIVAIVGLAINLVRLMASPDNQKLKKNLQNWAIGLIMIFILPLVINLTMGLLDDSFELTACWNNAEKTSTTGKKSDYIDPSKDKNKTNGFINDAEDYKTGNPQSRTGGGSASINKMIFIGDSRTEGMHQVVSSSDVWSYQSSMGLNWMKSTGVPAIDGQVAANNAVVILMGVNDLYQPGAYLSYVNGKASEWASKNARVFFVSVNPTDGSQSSLNSSIDSFNQQIRDGLSTQIHYIDTNSYLKSSGFSTTDGLHYTSDTYQKIYDYIKTNLS